MKREHMDDEIFADLLRDALAAEATAPSAECLDAGTAAVWADGRLDRTARRALERHAAGCARCQALLAALVRTAPEARPRWWQRVAIRWVVPATVAVSAAALVWMAVPRPPAAPTAPASRDEVGRIAERTAPEAPQPAPEPPPPETRSLRPRGSPVRRDAPGAVAQSGSPQRQQPQDAAKKDAPADARNEARESLKQSGAANETTALTDRAAATPPSASPPAEAKTAAKPSILAAPQLLMKSAVGGLTTATIASPDPAVAWRIVPKADATVVERTVDGGRSWQQTTEPGARVSAGAAPAAGVCWLVGPAGAVLITSDGGATWQRLPPPASADLVRVSATDAQSAFVTAADGRRFATSDGGRTWVAGRRE